MMTKASATAFSKWLLQEHPGVFATILKSRGAKLSGFGDDELEPVDVTAQYIGDPLQNVDVTASYYTPGTIDLSAANATTPNLLANIGSGIGSAVSNVASFVLKSTAALAPVAVAAINAQSSAANRNAQLAVLNTQVSRASAGVAPANISYLSDGTPVYVPSAPVSGGLTTLPAGLGTPVVMPNGQTAYTLTPQALQNLQPSFLQKYGIWILGGGAALAAFLLLG